MHKQALALPLERPADAVDSRFTKALATHSAPRLRIADRCDADTTRLWLPKSCAGTEIHQDGHSRHFCNSTSPTSEGSETNKLCTCLARSRSRHMLGEADSRKRSGVASVGGQLANGISSLAAFARVGGSSLQCGFAFRRRALPITKGLPFAASLPPNG